MGTIIRTPDQRVRVFVSSTLQELAEERQAAREAIQHLRLTPVLFELGARPHPPRPLYRAYLAQSDIFIGIYWQRYGWIAPGEEISGLEDEFRLAGDRPKLIYVKTPAQEREPGLAALLNRVRDEDGVSYKPFLTARQLRELIENDLALVLTESFAQARLPESVQTNEPRRDELPVPRSPLINRVRETAMVRELLLRQDVGLVTLTGPGGSGKTRLALHVASTLREDFEHGVVYVSLGPVTDPTLVAPTIAQSLGLRESPGHHILEVLLAALRPKRLLLVLDNFEQVLAAASLLAQLLEHCPHLSILVTSRALLHLRNEHEVAIPPLAVPDVYALPELGRLSQYAAVELFITRAREVKPSFEVTNDTAPAVAEICQRLDGLPLAIELAAARVKLFPPRTLLARLERRLPELVTGARDLPERQQTLRRAIEWSYDLLEPQEQALFRQLSVFVGGFTLAAAQAVCTVDHPRTVAPADDQLLQGVEQLLDQSLLWVQEGFEGEPRFGMLETIREFGRVQLASSGEEGSCLRRHALWCLNLAEEAEPNLTSSSRGPWIEQLVAEQDNLRAALRRSLWQNGDVEIAVRLAAALTWFWFLLGRMSEGLGWLKRAVDAADAATYAIERAKALFGVGGLAIAHGDFAWAASAIDESVSLYQEAGETCWLARARTLQGTIKSQQGQEVDLAELLDTVKILSDQDDRWWQAFALQCLGDIRAHSGDSKGAGSCYQEGLAIYQDLGDAWGAGSIRFALGSLAAAENDYPLASEHFHEALGLLSEAHDRYGATAAIADAAGHLGEYARAEALWRDSLRQWQDMGNVMYGPVGLAGIASCLQRQGRNAEAALLFGSLAHQLQEMEPEQVGAVEWAYADMCHESLAETLATARREASPTTAAQAWKEGEKMTLEDAVARALRYGPAET